MNPLDNTPCGLPDLDRIYNEYVKGIEGPSPVPPPPTFELTLEQRLTISKMDLLFDQVSKAELKQMVVALQTQNYALGNNVSHLVKAWTLNFSKFRTIP